MPIARFSQALAIALVLGLSPAIASVEVKGVTFAARLETDGQTYRLLGHGLFRYLIWDAYAGAYYQAEGYPRPAPQATHVPRRLELAYFHAIEAAELSEVTRDTLRDRLGEAGFRALRPALAAFSARYRDVSPGDRYVLTWNGRELILSLNGERLYARPEPALANALFGLWLGERPLGEGFRNALLGR